MTDDLGDWAPILDELARRRQHAESMGGPDRLDRHRAKGKLDARQRLDLLFDPGTFVELGAFVGTIPPEGQPDAPADGLVAGMGMINGLPAVPGQRTSPCSAAPSAPARPTSATASASWPARSGCRWCSCSRAPATG